MSDPHTTGISSSSGGSTGAGCSTQIISHDMTSCKSLTAVTRQHQPTSKQASKQAFFFFSCQKNSVLAVQAYVWMYSLHSEALGGFTLCGQSQWLLWLAGLFTVVIHCCSPISAVYHGPLWAPSLMVVCKTPVTEYQGKCMCLVRSGGRLVLSFSLFLLSLSRSTPMSPHASCLATTATTAPVSVVAIFTGTECGLIQAAELSLVWVIHVWVAG